MKCEAICKHSPEFSVRKMCKVLGVYENQYYRWCRSEEKRRLRKESEQHIIELIVKIYEESNQVYGCRKIHREAIKTMAISEWKVRKIMKENGIYSVSNKKVKPKQGKRKKGGKYSENIVKRNFNADKFGQIWAGDITYIKTNIGWTYLSVVMDLYNREIIGYHVSKEINTELAICALNNAKARFSTQKNMIFHSDRGCQYSSRRYQKKLDDLGIRSSMSAPGCPYDNSCVESFFAEMKKECIQRKKYDTIEDVKKDLFKYIELFYNRKRLHSTLGYMSPVEYRMMHENRKTA